MFCDDSERDNPRARSPLHNITIFELLDTFLMVPELEGGYDRVSDPPELGHKFVEDWKHQWSRRLQPTL